MPSFLGSIGSALGVSRNTLRQAFRLLAHERLLVHEFNRGVSIRRLNVEDVHDLCSVRRLVEGGVLRVCSPDARLDDVRSAVEEGEQAAAEGRWVDVGTANMRFHQAYAGRPAG